MQLGQGRDDVPAQRHPSFLAGVRQRRHGVVKVEGKFVRNSRAVEYLALLIRFET